MISQFPRRVFLQHSNVSPDQLVCAFRDPGHQLPCFGKCREKFWLEQSNARKCTHELIRRGHVRVVGEKRGAEI